MTQNVANIIAIKCNNCDKNVVKKLQNEGLNESITPFVLHVVLQRVVLSWIIDNNQHLKFDIEEYCGKCMLKGPSYNTTIFLLLNGQKIEGFLNRTQGHL